MEGPSVAVYQLPSQLLRRSQLTVNLHELLPSHTTCGVRGIIVGVVVGVNTRLRGFLRLNVLPNEVAEPDRMSAMLPCAGVAHELKESYSS